MGTPTATVRASKPAIGGDLAPTWPNEINLSFDMFDRAANQRLTIALSDANMTLTADGSIADQANYQGLNFTGSLSASRTVTLPPCQKYGWVQNSTTGGFAIILTTGGGASLSVPGDGVQYTYFCDGTNIISLTSATLAANIIGTTTNDSAAAGRLGEYISSNVTDASGAAVTTNTNFNVTSISLTAGDWDVSGTLTLIPSALNITTAQAWTNTVSATVPADTNFGGRSVLTNNAGVMAGLRIPFGPQRLLLSGTTTVYLSGLVIFASGTCTASGFIGARRAR